MNSVADLDVTSTRFSSLFYKHNFALQSSLHKFSRGVARSYNLLKQTMPVLGYSRTSMARTPIARLPSRTGTLSWIPTVQTMRILWSNFCIYVFVLLFPCSIVSDRRSLKIKNENNNRKTLKSHLCD